VLECDRLCSHVGHLDRDRRAHVGGARDVSTAPRRDGTLAHAPLDDLCGLTRFRRHRIPAGTSCEAVFNLRTLETRPGPRHSCRSSHRTDLSRAVLSAARRRPVTPRAGRPRARAGYGGPAAGPGRIPVAIPSLPGHRRIRLQPPIPARRIVPRLSAPPRAGSKPAQPLRTASNTAAAHMRQRGSTMNHVVRRDVTRCSCHRGGAERIQIIGMGPLHRARIAREARSAHSSHKSSLRDGTDRRADIALEEP
jgi:hypothetical protein